VGYLGHPRSDPRMFYISAPVRDTLGALVLNVISRWIQYSLRGNIDAMQRKVSRPLRMICVGGSLRAYFCLNQRAIEMSGWCRFLWKAFQSMRVVEIMSVDVSINATARSELACMTTLKSGLFVVWGCKQSLRRFVSKWECGKMC
jgi:hypothetical protein